MKYRKKPVVVEAVRFQKPWKAVLAFCPLILVKEANNGPVAFAVVKTPEGVMRADIGDWIVRGVEGEFYPVKDSIFQKTYEACDAD